MCFGGRGVREEGGACSIYSFVTYICHYIDHTKVVFGFAIILKLILQLCIAAKAHTQPAEPSSSP